MAGCAASFISNLAPSASFFAEPLIKRKSFSSGEKSFFMLYYLVSDRFQYRGFVYNPFIFHYGEFKRIVAEHRYLPGIPHRVLVYKLNRSVCKNAVLARIAGLPQPESNHILRLFFVEGVYYIFQR